MSGYPSPGSELLSLGDPREMEEREESESWIDYRKFGLGPGDVPDLIRMARDPALHELAADNPEVFAPLHAWRALGQLRAEAAIEPLLELLQEADERDDDWALEEVPEVLAMIGPAALPALERFLDIETNGLYARIAAAKALEYLARDHPETREPCVAILVRRLERLDRKDAQLNGFLIDNLIELGADEAAPAIERAFAAGCVDESIVGEWERVEWELGLREEPPPIKLRDGRIAHIEPPDPALFRPARDHKAKERAKAKRKQAAKSRKRNRKKRR
jgi:hypothetical protein